MVQLRYTWRHTETAATCHIVWCAGRGRVVERGNACKRPLHGYSTVYCSRRTYSTYRVRRRRPYSFRYLSLPDPYCRLLSRNIALPAVIVQPRLYMYSYTTIELPMPKYLPYAYTRLTYSYRPPPLQPPRQYPPQPPHVRSSHV